MHFWGSPFHLYSDKSLTLKQNLWRLTCKPRSKPWMENHPLMCGEVPVRGDSWHVYGTNLHPLAQGHQDFSGKFSTFRRMQMPQAICVRKDLWILGAATEHFLKAWNRQRIQVSQQPSQLSTSCHPGLKHWCYIGHQPSTTWLICGRYLRRTKELNRS